MTVAVQHDAVPKLGLNMEAVALLISVGKERFPRWGIQVDLKTGESENPKVVFSKHHMICPHTETYLLLDVLDDPTLIRGFTPLSEEMLGNTRDPGQKVGYVTVWSRNGNCLVSNLVNADGWVALWKHLERYLQQKDIGL